MKSNLFSRMRIVYGITISIVVWTVTAGNFFLPLQREIVMLAGFRELLGIGALAAFFMLLVSRCNRWAVAALLMALYHGGGVLSYSIPESAAHAMTAKQPLLKIMYANIDRPSRSWEGLRKIAAEFNPDILIVDEVDDIWQIHLAWADSAYPVRIATWDNFGMAMYSRIPLSDSEIQTEPGRFGKTITARFPWNGTHQRIYATHLNSPVDAAGFLKQSRQFDTVIRAVQSFPESTLVVGDFNACETRREFRRLLADCGLHDSREGFGWQNSWPFGWPVVTLPLDHVLLPDGWRVVDRRLGPAYGSDHRPVLLTVAVGN